jgi:hypothetical protein
VPRAKAAPKPKAAAPPAVRWLLRPGEEFHGCGVVELKGEVYLVSPVYRDPWADHPRLEGYRFRRLDALRDGKKRDPRDVDLRIMECSCPHYLYRCRNGGLCKHLACLEEILT